MGDHEVDGAAGPGTEFSQGDSVRGLAGRVSAGQGVVLGAVFCAGAGTMVVELAAVRLLAPWFGASTGVWT
ncbi:MAG: hypothetical protein QF615_14190, partial [Planctomycetota bacterium]|nr:hypothetical protein [Planctomycetota bacterium]